VLKAHEVLMRHDRLEALPDGGKSAKSFDNRPAWCMTDQLIGHLPEDNRG
jgi:hypothetical protein